MRLISRLFVLCILAAMLLAGWMFYFATTPTHFDSEVLEVDLKAGSSLRGISEQLESQGAIGNAWGFTLLVRLMGRAGEVKAGNYLFESGITPYEIFITVTDGKTTQSSITFIEGWTFAQMRAAMMNNDSIKHVTIAYTDQQILENIGASDSHPEGLFFPDTYFFSRGMSDQDILKRAYHAMRERLDKAWQTREAGLPYKTPYEALIMASIIEKETGRGDERQMIAGVFVNRLRMGMRLQTDPTVIYGMGEGFDGNIRKKDLQVDTLYNTYTRAGLPPTPIAMPGLASIEAALHPAKTKALYFVGKGDGSHAFSSTLAEHNRAVGRYQLGKRNNAR
ncbi:Endolytic murein transglycosylase [Methylophilaceae bacterium]|nr:Endolytic murein transglycosylase [Methylophilaceae bacterium]